MNHFPVFFFSFLNHLILNFKKGWQQACKDGHYLLSDKTDMVAFFSNEATTIIKLI